ncbi:sigma-70 family RNA polymerase sigma factor [Cytophagaceae bacterium DM2B3-1]|uniref:Sigma-70 family RNA polymerase sigma factor n=1 Tax=Xanthocytophaga flava TaxID=3048013 RepID=A0ABT7CU46_9BACT|nr:sigma-70 family RNA polymerase sigma factor [Xanthocytophaga flavus]MDJ1473792.1 sigma-70 family RNA polymerase sigma factor [Xanthocytophaga flavus]MDJ1497279.1 sigma-70 family RNA polymerase sigma factor [Xanthocytophaga flavus]
MKTPVDTQFIQHINENIGIAHKVCRIYFEDTEERADMLQEMMYQLWKSYPGFDARSKFSTWMYQVCLNTALGWRRKHKQTQDERISLKHYGIAEPGQDQLEESIQQLFRAIGTLSSLNKAIVLLYLDEMSYEEIAAITGLTRSNVSVRLVRIKKELEEQLKKTNVTNYVNS